MTLLTHLCVTLVNHKYLVHCSYVEISRRINFRRKINCICISVWFFFTNVYSVSFVFVRFGLVFFLLIDPFVSRILRLPECFYNNSAAVILSRRESYAPIFPPCRVSHGINVLLLIGRHKNIIYYKIIFEKHFRSRIKINYYHPFIIAIGLTFFF